ncbi:MAG: E3 binding domain-containing protein, partial [Actinobacteria bacterium]|nr:E3 binding domain-containing protein [Actinomycetota bacterium]
EVLAEIAAGDGAAATEAPEAGDAEAPAAGDGATGDGARGEIVDIVTPGAGESVTEGTLLEWHVAEGDSVRADQTVCEISTDKVDVELPAPRAGTITELLAAEGDTVTVGQVVARMRSGAGAPATGTGATSGNGGAAVGDGGSAAAGTAPADVLSRGGQADQAVAPISPVARRMAAAEGVDVSALRGSGPQGRITKADVEAARYGRSGAYSLGRLCAGAVYSSP